MKPRRKLALFSSVAVAVGVALLMVARSRPEPVLLPSPNGFDGLEEAHAAITPWRLQELGIRSRSAADQQKILLFNANALELARTGLEKDIRVDAATPDSGRFAFHLDSLAQLFEIEADYSLNTGDTNRLLSAQTALLDLTSKATAGLPLAYGPFLNKTRRRVLEQLTKIVDLRDASLCRAVALKLHDSVAHMPTFENYLDNQRRRDSTSPAMDRVWRTFSPVQVYSRYVGGQRQHRRAFAGALKALRQLESETLRDLAAAAFRLEHGRAATNWAELVPEYLPEIPRNATNNAPLPLVGI